MTRASSDRGEDGEWQRQVRRVHIVEFTPAEESLRTWQVHDFLSKANHEIAPLGPHVHVQAGVGPGIVISFMYREFPHRKVDEIELAWWETTVLRALVRLDAHGSVKSHTLTAVVPRSIAEQT
jgi:hypothetical protein